MKSGCGRAWLRLEALQESVPGLSPSSCCLSLEFLGWQLCCSSVCLYGYVAFSLLHRSLCLLLCLLQGHQALGLGPLCCPGCSHLEILTFLTPTKTPCPSKLTVTSAAGQDGCISLGCHSTQSRGIFWGDRLGQMQLKAGVPRSCSSV